MGSDNRCGDGMCLTPVSVDRYFSFSEMNSQGALLKKLRSQESMGIIQRDDLDAPSVIEPENFSFMNVGVHNLSIRQDVRFPADLLKSHSTNNPW